MRRYNDDPDWEEHLTELCSRPHIVGLDIHPFAVLMAQIRFMVAILPEYREAKRQNSEFTLRRLPIFRTDSLQNERESAGADLGDDGWRQLTFQAMTEDNQDVLIPVPLPIEVDEQENSNVETDGGFLVRRVRMPLFDTIQLETGVSNFGEYFAALQGVLDVVKFHMREDEWEYVGGLEEGIGRYATREYGGIEGFFEPYVNEILETARYLRDEHGDGRLFKIFEDSMLALVVKNYMTYDYVVGNPPYVEIQNLPEEQKAYLSELYESATGQYDIYCQFYERGLDWLTENTGKLGYITPNQFMVTEYGEGIRRVICRKARISEVYDFRDSGVFKDATNYPAIVILEHETEEQARLDNSIRCVRVKANVDESSGRQLDKAIIDAVRNHNRDPGYSDDYIDVFDFPQAQLGDDYWSFMPPEEHEVIKKLESSSDAYLSDITEAIFHGPTTGANTIYVVEVLDAYQVNSADRGGVVKVVPSGSNEQFEIETDLLRPWLSGSDIRRWRSSWSGGHVILPYVDNDDGEYKLLSLEEFQNEYPKTWDYLGP